MKAVFSEIIAENENSQMPTVPMWRVERCQRAYSDKFAQHFFRTTAYIGSNTTWSLYDFGYEPRLDIVVPRFPRDSACSVHTPNRRPATLRTVIYIFQTLLTGEVAITGGSCEPTFVQI